MAQTIRDNDLNQANQPDPTAPVGTMGQSTSQKQQNQMGQSGNQQANSNNPPQLGFTGQNNQQPAQQNPPRQKGTGFTNIQNILGANQGNQLGSTIQKGVTQQAQGVKQDLNNSFNTYQQQVNQNRLDTQANQNAVAQAITDPTQSIGSTNQAQQMQALFAKIRQGQYTGPTQMSNADQLQNEAMTAQQLGQSASSEAGRLGLLQRFAAGNNQQYNQGQQTLDNLLLGAGGQQNLNAIKAQTQGLGQQVTQQQNAAAQLAQNAQQGAQQFKQNTLQQLSQASQQAEAPIQQQFQQAQSAEQTRQQQYDQLQKLASGQITNAQYLENAGRSSDVAGMEKLLNNQNWGSEQYNDPAARGAATQLYIKQLQDMGLTDQAQSNQLQNQLVQNRGLYSYNTDDATLLSQALQNQQAQNLTEASVATPEQRAKLNALAQLSGQTSKFGNDQSIGQYQAGKTNFDFNQLQGAISGAVDKETQARAAEAAARAKAAQHGGFDLTPAELALLALGGPMGMAAAAGGQATGAF